MSRPRKTPEKHVSRHVDLRYVSVEDAIKSLQEAAEGLRNPTVDIELDEWYGQTSIICKVEGYAPMTAEDIAEKRAEERRLSLEAEARDRATYEKLKERFG